MASRRTCGLVHAQVVGAVQCSAVPGGVCVAGEDAGGAARGRRGRGSKEPAKGAIERRRSTFTDDDFAPKNSKKNRDLEKEIV